MTTRPPGDDLTVLHDLVPVAGRRMVDVGCGPGDLVRRLAAEGADAVGLEISQEQLATALARDPEATGSYVVGLAEDLPFADASVDAVLFMKSLHHVPADAMDGALAEARRVLTADGAVLVVEPLTDGTMFELVRRIDDETEVRRLAQEALGRAGAAGLVSAAVREYETRPSFADFTALCDLITGVDPARAGDIAAARDELEQAFERLADRDAATGAYTLVAPMRAELLRPA
ncbi:class I SAM-dependent methyltransferase [Baekduia soli]|uniref:Class I SAM-dependent methyltransferase n=1 Tax=Baekduia soli TaxID=496014 RepID=A0A5B8UAP2_9ACTN|nr:class I SAM-dependent methyltransferase [Baekduia soli]QEC49742.1 class I SAM-dependent methyltransferase [Baekduia soli]